MATQTKQTQQPFIPLSVPVLGGKEWEYVKEALDTGWVSSVGPAVDRLETEMAAHFNVPKTLATVSGTAALHMALRLADVNTGDEVIVPTLTFMASVNPILYQGATPVFWDSQSDHFNADVTQLESLITEKTKAIMVVHLLGCPVEMDTVLEVAKKHNIKVIEDAAEAIGGAWKGSPCGALGWVGTLSFNGNKTMTTGGGGLMISSEQALIEKAYYWVNQSKDDGLRFIHNELGYNYRMTNLEAAVGVAQFEQLSGFLAKRKAICERYDVAFSDNDAFTLFETPEHATHSHWLYAVRLNPKTLGANVDVMAIIRALNKEGIGARPLFYPGHQQEYLKAYVPEDQTFPNAEALVATTLCLPTSSNLTEAEQTRVIETVLANVDALSL